MALFAEAERTGNVAETCRRYGVSRARYYEWRRRADLYGLEALIPEGRRRPHMAAPTSTHVVEALLTGRDPLHVGCSSASTRN